MSAERAALLPVPGASLHSALRGPRAFRRLWALLAHRAKRAGITPEDVDREIAAHRISR